MMACSNLLINLTILIFAIISAIILNFSGRRFDLVDEKSFD